MTSQKSLEERTSSTRGCGATQGCPVSFSVPLRPGAAEPPACSAQPLCWGCCEQHMTAALQGQRASRNPSRAHVRLLAAQTEEPLLRFPGTTAEHTTYSNTNTVCITSHQQQELFFAQTSLTVQRSSAVSCTLYTIKFGCPKSTRFGHRQ